MDLSFIAQEISGLQEKGHYRRLRRVSTPQDRTIVIEGRELLNFSSNNYLGLANHPEVVGAFAEYARKYGVGSGASRLIGGNMDVHLELEDALACFKGMEACLTFSSGYLANPGILATLGSPQAAIFSDELNHASIVDGCRLSRAQVKVYRHADAIATPSIFEQQGILGDVAFLSGVMAEELAKLKGRSCIGDIRHKGLMVGVEIVKDRHTKTPFPPEEKVGQRVVRKVR